MHQLDPWVLGILADPITKLPSTPGLIGISDGVIDARRFMPNTPGFNGWKDGQRFYESWHDDQRDLSQFQAEIEGVRPVYQHITMSGRVLDVGGHLGLVREFLNPDVEFVSVDPFIDIQKHINANLAKAYTCLSRQLNFIAACAEFLPFTAATFDWVHMRSMLDHVQSPDLALMEARRVLKPGSGRLVIGLWIKGGRSGRAHLRPKALAKETARTLLGMIGVTKYRDRHTFHPDFAELVEALKHNRFEVIDAYWQPQWKDQVCYLTAMPT